jgi:hypothetical protein
MSPTKRNYEAVADSARDRARQAAAQVKPVAAQVKPLAKSSQAAARRGVHRSRAWAAPQVERTGQVLQDSVAPKVSALLSSAAQRLDPAKPSRHRWRKPAGIAMVTAAASALAAAIRNGRKSRATTSAAQGAHVASVDHVTPVNVAPPDVAPVDQVAPVTKMPAGPADVSTDADVNGQVRTS